MNTPLRRSVVVVVVVVVVVDVVVDQKMQKFAAG